MSDQEEPKAPAPEEPAPTPAAEIAKEDEFDPARAMALIEKLRGEIKELKPKAKKAEELAQAEQQRKEAEMTELQKLQTRLEKAEADLKEAKLSDLRRAIAIKVELPLAFAERLRGETPEELEEDAKKLVDALPKQAKPPKVEPTAPGPGAGVKETIDQRRARIYGGNIDPLFDPEYAKTHGGGVVWKDS